MCVSGGGGGGGGIPHKLCVCRGGGGVYTFFFTPSIHSLSEMLMVSAQYLSFSDPNILKFIWYLTINRKQVEFIKEDYVSVWPVVMAFAIHVKIANFWFPYKNLSLNE